MDNEKESMAEGDAGDIGAFIGRICAVFAKMDLDNSDSIEMEELTKSWLLKGGSYVPNELFRC